MGKNYRQLSLEERCAITRLRAEGESIRQIATIMDRAASTIAREIKRNQGLQGNYKASYADEKAWARRWRGSKLERQPSLQKYVIDSLVMGMSPQQIAGRLKLDNYSTYISHESIYRFIYAQYARTKDNSWRLLLHRGKFKRGSQRRKGGGSVSFIKHRTSIDKRPKYINKRKEFGHWEADLIMFSNKKDNVLVMQERKSRFIALVAQTDKKAKTVIDNKKEILSSLPTNLRRTITMDNGTEFASHYELTQDLNMQTYFCDPHSPWQKGGIENINGRLRRYLPRKTNISSITDQDLQLLALQLNSTPRKCLDYKTPIEVLSPYLLHFKCELTFPFSWE